MYSGAARDRDRDQRGLLLQLLAANLLRFVFLGNVFVLLNSMDRQNSLRLVAARQLDEREFMVAVHGVNN